MLTVTVTGLTLALLGVMMLVAAVVVVWLAATY